MGLFPRTLPPPPPPPNSWTRPFCLTPPAILFVYHSWQCNLEAGPCLHALCPPTFRLAYRRGQRLNLRCQSHCSFTSLIKTSFGSLPAKFWPTVFVVLGNPSGNPSGGKWQKLQTEQTERLGVTKGSPHLNFLQIRLSIGVG